MKTTVWILGDQLSPHASALDDLAPSDCIVLMIESLSRARRLPYHKQKLVLAWSAMRHFAEELRELGYSVDYFAAQQDLRSPLAAHIKNRGPARMRLMETAEPSRSTRLARLVRTLGVDVEITPNNMFLSDRAESARNARDKKTLLMETFYHHMRRRTGLLMDGQAPVGGQWNYDRLDRERPRAGHSFPPVPYIEPDKITRDVMAFVEREFPENFGELDAFGMPVIRGDANAFLEDFLDNRLDLFGPYEDAIVVGQRGLYHSLISPLLNIGLLEPLDVCRRAEARYYDGRVRLNSVEGLCAKSSAGASSFTRFTIGECPNTSRSTFFGRLAAARVLLDRGHRHGVYCRRGEQPGALGNQPPYPTPDDHRQFRPDRRNRSTGRQWYWLAQADACEWVVTPNVLGLSLYADGRLIATKPYAASANYINKMSDCCQHCAYDRRQTVDEKACTVNALYWDFLARNRQKLQDNPRMNLMLALLDKRHPQELNAFRQRALQIRNKLRNTERL
jgi:deoxyribodipyrimidine photolyase-related protein